MVEAIICNQDLPLTDRDPEQTLLSKFFSQVDE